MFEDYAQLQSHVLCAQDFEMLAQTKIDHALFAYLSGGSGQELSLKRNLDTFAGMTLTPNSLENVTDGNSHWHYREQRFSAPILLAPVAHQTLLHADGERACAQAAEALEQGMVLSTLSGYSLEDVADAANGWKAFQLYAQPRQQDSFDLIHRAHQAGYQAVVITVDAPVQQVSLQARHLGFKLPPEKPINLRPYEDPPSAHIKPDESYIFKGIMAQALNWQSLQSLMDYSRQLGLKVWVKGVLDPKQAQKLQTMGADALIVSNHGGRALDSAISSLEALPTIRQSVGPEMTLLLDSGIRCGQDIFKALASGADAVLVGRLQAYALGVAGALGVAHLLKLLTEELQLTMALCGCSNLQDIRMINLGDNNDV
ncbi:alpha-hydroxy acid oxidase [Thiomicrorhabdus sp. 6S3-12]|uniref:alpha-hydroxy acid oxidase n=1 Tax=Thiomicrorhabdus sp. 6S3-12 TaxID=2819681 RepID=UPI001AAD2C89|nr:alpha-hydroxy acid oxidase [Thiomicrorhabdus sp. 6S3-12]MBO1924645.1 alpha-hydroxy-acid oxidizing protein [Thiomicrorhabdus sp. 6S3-12]